MNNVSSLNFETGMIDQIKSLILASWGIIYIVFGSFGTILNLFAFTRRTRWTLSPSIPYLLASTIAGIPIMYIAVLTRVGIGFQITPFYTIAILCKGQIFISNLCPSLVIWFMVGSCWDRYLSSSRSAITRRMSSTRTSHRVIFAITLCVSIAYAQIFYCFEAGLTTLSAPCAAKNLSCSIIDTILAFLLQYMTPIVLTVFLLTGIYFNIRQVERPRQVQSSLSSHQPTEAGNKREGDRIILRLVSVQVVFFLLCSTPLFTFRLYSTITSAVVKSSLRRAVENLIFNVALMLFYFEKVFLFYIHILTSRHFREILWRYTKAIYRRNIVAPQR